MSLMFIKKTTTNNAIVAKKLKNLKRRTKK